MELCGVDTSKLPVMTHREMREMIPLVQAGDRALREQFIRSNLRLVLSVIKRFTNRAT